MKPTTRTSHTAVSATGQLVRAGPNSRSFYENAHLLDQFVAPGLKENERPAIVPKRNPKIAELHSMFKTWMSGISKEGLDSHHIPMYFQNIFAMIGEKHYTSAQIERFSLELAHHQDHPHFNEAGLFLSALINTSPSRRFTIHTSHLDPPLDYLGYRNRAHLVVEGGTGRHAGLEMEGGSILVQGSSGPCVGEQMTRGSITVMGDCDYYAGNDMLGGALTIHGNATDSVGSSMTGGCIILHGNAGKEAGGHAQGGTLVVYGNAGKEAGCHMYEGGHVTIKGNCEELAGKEMSGTLIIEGNAGHWAGYYMDKGQLQILGNCDWGVGAGMKGGEITIQGLAVSVGGERMSGGTVRVGSVIKEGLDGVRGGNVFVGGIQLVRNGHIQKIGESI